MKWWLCINGCWCLLKTMLLILIIVSLTGCGIFFGHDGFFRDRLGDYNQEEVASPLKMPNGLDPIPVNTQYSIPGKPVLVSTATHKKNKKISQEFIVPRAELSLEQPDGSAYRLDMNHNPKRLWVNKNTKTLWPAVMDYLNTKHIKVAINNEKNKMILTAPIKLNRYISEKKKENTPLSWDLILSHWLDSKSFKRARHYTAQHELRLKFLLRTDNSPSNSAVMISPVLESMKTTPDKIDHKSLDEQTSEVTLIISSLLSDLATFLAQEESTGVNAFLLEDEKANLQLLSSVEEDGNGLPILNIRNISFARGWRAVEKALRTAKIKITDKNRSSGLYYVEWKDGGINATKHKGGSKARKNKRPQEANAYRIRVGVASEIVQVSIEKSSSSAASLEASTELLDIIKTNLR